MPTVFIGLTRALRIIPFLSIYTISPFSSGSMTETVFFELSFCYLKAVFPYGAIIFRQLILCGLSKE